MVSENNLYGARDLISKNTVRKKWWGKITGPVKRQKSDSIDNGLSKLSPFSRSYLSCRRFLESEIKNKSVWTIEIFSGKNYFIPILKLAHNASSKVYKIWIKLRNKKLQLDIIHQLLIFRFSKFEEKKNFLTCRYLSVSSGISLPNSFSSIARNFL